MGSFVVVVLKRVVALLLLGFQSFGVLVEEENKDRLILRPLTDHMSDYFFSPACFK